VILKGAALWTAGVFGYRDSCVKPKVAHDCYPRPSPVFSVVHTLSYSNTMSTNHGQMAFEGRRQGLAWNHMRSTMDRPLGGNHVRFAPAPAARSASLRGPTRYQEAQPAMKLDEDKQVASARRPDLP
jgi:hypothetical protein